MTSTSTSSSSSSPPPTCPYAKAHIVTTPSASHRNDNASHDDSTQVSTPSSSTNTTPTLSSASSNPAVVMEALELAKTSCPAFQNHACPFRNAHNAEEMRKAMLSVPSSHLDGAAARTAGTEGGTTKKGDVSGMFRVALEHVHSVSVALHHKNEVDGEGVTRAVPDVASGGERPTADAGTTKTTSKTAANFLLDGGCPFKTYYQRSTLTTNNNNSGEGSMEAHHHSAVLFVDSMEELSLTAIMARMVDEMHREQDTPRQKEEQEKNKQLLTHTKKETTENSDDASSLSTSESSSSPPPAPLSYALKTGTAQSHSAAENVHFVKNFIRGKIDRTLYSHLVTSLYYVYTTLEQELHIHAPTFFPQLHHPQQLNRTESLQDDMDFYHGPNWSMTQQPSCATRDYMERVRHIAKVEPLLLLSHAYTRYLGDLSGGRILARVARKALNLSKDSNDGLQFYVFDGIDNTKQFKDSYRRSLDGLNLTADQVERLVAEANVAFVLNMRLFEELDVMAHVPGAHVRDLKEATDYLDRVVRQQKMKKLSSSSSSPPPMKSKEMTAGKEGGATGTKCPFASLGGPNPHGSKKIEDVEERSGTSASHESKVKTDGSDSNVAATITAKKTKRRCPWPFILFHDPMEGMKDYQTWIVLGLILCWIWTTIQKSLSS